jgi:hypothetical protein
MVERAENVERVENVGRVGGHCPRLKYVDL